MALDDQLVGVGGVDGVKDPEVDDIEQRPIHHRLEARSCSHVIICMLVPYLVWPLREALARPTFTDEAPPSRADSPVAFRAMRSAQGSTQSQR